MKDQEINEQRQSLNIDRLAKRFRFVSAIAWGLLLGLTFCLFSSSLQAQSESPQPVSAGNTAETPAVSDVVPSTQSNKPYIPSGLLEVMKAMGFVFVIPFAAASFIAVWFAIERLVILRRARVIPRPFVERFLQNLEEGGLDQEAALTLCEENNSPVARVFAHGILKWGKPSVEVEQAIIDGGERQTSQLRKHLRVLNGVATVTPLLGLLVTVTGMIQAFNQIANTVSMGKAEELAVWIVVALLTTAAGLIISIPSLLLYIYLSGRVDSIVMEMDESAQSVVKLISAEALSGQIATPRTIQAKKKTKSAKRESA